MILHEIGDFTDGVLPEEVFFAAIAEPGFKRLLLATGFEGLVAELLKISNTNS